MSPLTLVEGEVYGQPQFLIRVTAPSFSLYFEVTG